ncbi:MAG: tRNA glutamyl-Q(34) synthetase GluQRS [Pseudomonadota bacterium]
MTGPIHTERFAPSPTGRLHLGHAYSAILAHDRARAASGRFLLRMEDLDRSRVRDAYYDGILDDLRWLGLRWDGPVEWQSKRVSLYERALSKLRDLGLTYICTCSRRDIAEAVSAPQEGAPLFGPDGLVYPGTCRLRRNPDSTADAIRLNLERAIYHLGGPRQLDDLKIFETGQSGGALNLNAEHLLSGTGDIVLRRRDGAAAYHLAVVVDDAEQGVTHVTRGEDLASAAPIQRVLQALLELPTSTYHHHRLIRDENGRRLAKRHDSLSLSQLKQDGASPQDIRRLVGLA